MINIKRLFTSFALLFWVYTLSAQEKRAGLVIDSKEMPVESALVIIVDKQSNKTLYTTFTDSLGRYRLNILPSNAVLWINALGYESYSIPFDEVSKKEGLFFTQLTEKIVLLDEVTVQGMPQARMVREGNRFVIDNIENSAYAKGKNAYAFLRYIPVLDVPVFEGNITVAGGGEVSLQINGRRTYLSQEDLLKSIRAEDIERIEVIAHPGAEYSGNISIINVVMKKRADEGLNSYLSLSDKHTSANSQNASYSLSYAVDKTYLTSGVFLGNIRSKDENNNSYRYYDRDFLTEQEEAVNTKIFDASAYVNLDYQWNSRNTLGVRVSAAGRDMNLKDINHTHYCKISQEALDSTYISTIRSTSPSFFSRLNTNLNYTLKTDDKGSTLFVDLDYVLNRPETENHALFDKQTGTASIRESDFIQNNNTSTNAFGLWGHYNHVFNSSTKLNSGISLSGALGKYNHFYGNYRDGAYVSDPNRTNNSTYDDFTMSIYSSFQKNWSEKLITILGLRLESYHAEGLQKEMNEKISRNETYLLPSLFLSYAPSDDHNFAFNASTSVARPKYSELNPFRTYTSPTSYNKGNPNLTINNLYKGGLSYSFFDDYSIDLQCLYVDNISTLFTIPDESNFIVTAPINYGNMLYIFPSFSISKTLFKGYLYLSGDMGYSYRSFNGNAQDIHIDTQSWILSFSANINLFFDKKKTFSSYIDYSYDGSSKNAASSSPADHTLQIAFTKAFSKSTFMLGINKELRNNNKLYYETANYGYTQLKKNFFNLYLTYSISFGNNKVRNINNRSNGEIQERFD